MRLLLLDKLSFYSKNPEQGDRVIRKDGQPPRQALDEPPANWEVGSISFFTKLPRLCSQSTKAKLQKSKQNTSVCESSRSGVISSFFTLKMYNQLYIFHISSNFKQDSVFSSLYLFIFLSYLFIYFLFN